MLNERGIAFEAVHVAMSSRCAECLRLGSDGAEFSSTAAHRRAISSLSTSRPEERPRAAEQQPARKCLNELRGGELIERSRTAPPAAIAQPHAREPTQICFHARSLRDRDP